MLPVQNFELVDSAYSFSHVLDFCSQIENLKIVPSTDVGELSTKEEFIQKLISPIGQSNILASTLTFDLSPFTSVQILELWGALPQNIFKCDSAKATVKLLKLTNTRIQSTKEILLPESIHETFSVDQYWKNVKSVFFPNNDIWTIDSSMQLIPNVEEIHLNDNRIRKVANLRSLSNLYHLNLSGNLIESLIGWHCELGNVEILNLSSNKIKSLSDLSKLRSLRSIDLSWNNIDSFDEVDEIAALPILESFSLNGNAIACEVDYRSRVLSRFGERCSEIILDNEKCSQTEIDKAMVLSSLRKAKIG